MLYLLYYRLFSLSFHFSALAIWVEQKYNYLEEPGNGAVELSAHILKEHKKRQKSELKISKDSLAIEILAHTYADIFSETVSSAELHLPAALSKAVLKLMKQVHAHTEIIDCGESDVDNNRWIWDGLTVGLLSSKRSSIRH